MTQDQFLSKYVSFKTKAQNARRLETESVGRDPLRALEDYKEAISIGRELLSSIDPEKVENHKKDNRIISVKRSIIELGLSFFVGILSSVAATQLI